MTMRDGPANPADRPRRPRSSRSPAARQSQSDPSMDLPDTTGSLPSSGGTEPPPPPEPVDDPAQDLPDSSGSLPSTGSNNRRSSSSGSSGSGRGGRRSSSTSSGGASGGSQTGDNRGTTQGDGQATETARSSDTAATTAATATVTPPDPPVTLSDSGRPVITDPKGKEFPVAHFRQLTVREQRLILDRGLDAWDKYRRERQRLARLSPQPRRRAMREMVRKHGGVMVALSKTFDADSPISVEDIISAGYDPAEIDRARSQIAQLSNEEMTTLRTRGMSGLRRYWGARSQERRRATEIVEQLGGVEQAIAQASVPDSVLLTAGYDQTAIDTFRSMLEGLPPPARELVESGGLPALQGRQTEVLAQIEAAGGIGRALSLDAVSIEDASLVYDRRDMPRLEAMRQIEAAGGIMRGLASGAIAPDMAVVAGYPGTDVARVLQSITQMPDEQRERLAEIGWGRYQVEIEHAQRQWEEYALAQPQGSSPPERSSPAPQAGPVDPISGAQQLEELGPGTRGREVRLAPGDQWLELPSGVTVPRSYYADVLQPVSASQEFAETGQSQNIELYSDSGERLVRVRDGYLQADTFFALPTATQQFMLEHGIEPYRRELEVRSAPVTPAGEQDDPLAHAARFAVPERQSPIRDLTSRFGTPDPEVDHLERQLASYQRTGDLSPAQLQNLLFELGRKRGYARPNEVRALEAIGKLTPVEHASSAQYDIRPILNETNEDRAAYEAALRDGTLTISHPDTGFGLQRIRAPHELIAVAAYDTLSKREWDSLPKWAVSEAATNALRAGLLGEQRDALPASIRAELTAGTPESPTFAQAMGDLRPTERAALMGLISLVQPPSAAADDILATGTPGPDIEEMRAKIAAGKPLTLADLAILRSSQSPESNAVMDAEFRVGLQDVLSDHTPTAVARDQDVFRLIGKAREEALERREWNSLPNWAVYQILSERGPRAEEWDYLPEPVKDYFIRTAVASRPLEYRTVSQDPELARLLSSPTLTIQEPTGDGLITPDEVRQFQLRQGQPPEPPPDLRYALGLYSTPRKTSKVEDSLAELLSAGIIETDTFNRSSIARRYNQLAAELGREYDELAEKAARKGESLAIPKYAFIDGAIGRPDQYVGKTLDLMPTAGEIAWRYGLGLVPGVHLTQGWGGMSGASRGLNLGLELLSVLPPVSAASMLRRAGLSVGKTLGTLAKLEGKGIVDTFRRPDKAIRSIGHTIEPLVVPGRLPTSAVEVRASTVRLPGSELGVPGALRARDVLTTKAIHGIQPITAVGGKRVELATTGLQRLTGPASIHATPDIRAFMQGAVVQEGREGGLFFAPTLHSRFLPSSAFGDTAKDGIPGALIIRDPAILNRFRSSGKIYKGTTEIEAVLPPGTRIPPPSQYLHLRDPAGNKIVLAVVGDKFTPAEIATLKLAGAKDTLVNIFRKPVSIRALRTYETLHDDAVRAVQRAEQLGDSAAAARASGQLDEAVELERQATVAIAEARAASRRVGALRDISTSARVVSMFNDRDVSKAHERMAAASSYVEPPDSFSGRSRALRIDPAGSFRPKTDLAQADVPPLRLISREDREDAPETELDPVRARADAIAHRSLGSRLANLALDGQSALASRLRVDPAPARSTVRIANESDDRVFRPLEPPVTPGRPPTIRTEPVRTPGTGRRQPTPRVSDEQRVGPDTDRAPRDPQPEREPMRAPTTDRARRDPQPEREPMRAPTTDRVPTRPTAAERDDLRIPTDERVSTRPPTLDPVPTKPPPTDRIPTRPPTLDPVPTRPPPTDQISARPPQRVRVPTAPPPTVRMPTIPPPPERVPAKRPPTIRVPARTSPGGGHRGRMKKGRRGLNGDRRQPSKRRTQPRDRRFVERSAWRQGFGYWVLDHDTGEKRFQLDRPTGVPDVTGPGSARESYTPLSYDDDPPTQAKLDMAAVEAVAGHSLQFRGKPKRRRRGKKSRI